MNITRRHAIALTGAGLAAAAWSGHTRAADKWPSRPIHWIVPYQAGTGPDNAARILAEAVGPLLGQAIVVENKGGAGGNLGARLAARASPDGYTWVYSASPMAANMRIYKDPGYDALKDFRHVQKISSSDILLVVNANSGIQSLNELVARAKAQPGKLNYASGGVGTPSHLGAELLLTALDVQVMHVPYKGANEIVQAVVGEQVNFGLPIFSVAAPLVQSGKLRALAVAGPVRNPRMPEVPTFAELGVRGVELTSWSGVSVPKGTPDAVVAKIRSAFERALKEPKVIAAMERDGGRVDSAPEAAYVQAFKNEMAFTESIMKKIGLQPS